MSMESRPPPPTTTKLFAHVFILLLLLLKDLIDALWLRLLADLKLLALVLWEAWLSGIDSDYCMRFYRSPETTCLSFTIKLVLWVRILTVFLVPTLTGVNPLYYELFSLVAAAVFWNAREFFKSFVLLTVKFYKCMGCMVLSLSL